MNRPWFGGLAAVVGSCLVLTASSARAAGDPASAKSVDDVALSADQLASVTPLLGSRDGDGPKGMPEAASSSLPQFDTVVNFSDQFIANGVDSRNRPRTVWPYTMVGQPPQANRKTVFNAPVIPVAIRGTGTWRPGRRVDITFGPPRMYERGERRPAQAYRETADELMAEIRTLYEQSR